MKRKAISKKTRFDVFKRDGFVCQYCGSHPPDVVLHVDHIQAVADGGQNDVDNLITACEACNLGKGARALTVVPESLKEKAERIAESEAQILGYRAVIAAKRERLDDEAFDICKMLQLNCRHVLKTDLRSVKVFIQKLGFDEVYEAADIATSKGFQSDSRIFKYFCGVCFRKIKDKAE